MLSPIFATRKKKSRRAPHTAARPSRLGLWSQDDQTLSATRAVEGLKACRPRRPYLRRAVLGQSARPACKRGCADFPTDAVRSIPRATGRSTTCKVAYAL